MKTNLQLSSKEELTRHVAELVTVKVHRRFDPRTFRTLVDVDAFIEHNTRSMVVELSSHLAAIGNEHISFHKKWPRTWWDAFKCRWFPTWLLRRYPADYDSVDIEEPRYKAVCPHLPIEREQTHLEWLSQYDS